MHSALKLRKKLASPDFANHLLSLKNYNEHGVVIVKIHCKECNKDIGGIGGEHSRSMIQNLFAIFKKSHLHCTLHIK